MTERGKAEIVRAAEEGGKIAVRTANVKSYETVKELGVAHVCLDEVYKNSRSFETLAKNHMRGRKTNISIMNRVKTSYKTTKKT